MISGNPAVPMPRPAVPLVVTSDDLRHGIGGMGELIARTNIACGKNSWIRRLQPRVYLDPVLVVLDTDRFESDPLNVRGASDTDQNLVDRHIVLLAM